MDPRLKIIILRNVRNAIDELLELDAPKEPSIDTTPELHVVSEPAPLPPADNVAPETTELDSEGLPWDARIHSVGKTQYKTGERKGQWIIKKKTDPAVLEEVKAELRIAYPPADTAPPAPPADTVPPVVTAPPTDTVPPAPPAGAVPPAPPADTAPPAEITSWGDLLLAISNAGLTPAEVQVACAKNHVANIGALQDSPSMVPAVAAELGLA